MNQTFRSCPVCHESAEPGAPRCPRCGFTFQAFSQPGYAPGVQASNVMAPTSPSSFFGFVRGIPVWLCFLIGFFLHIPAIVLMIFYYGDFPSKDRDRGTATLGGFAASFLIGCFLFVPLLLLPILFHGH